MTNATTPRLFAPAPATASRATFEATDGRAKRLAFIRSFNNACDVKVTKYVPTMPGHGIRDGYAFRGTNATARGVALGGFDVYTLGGDAFLAVRSDLTVFAGP